jgi:uncharacterized SAM-binding protein YcdF (DUF218 family)
VAIVAGALVVWLAPGWALPPLAHYLNISTPPRPVDYVLILNGDPDTRPFAAAAIARAGLAKEVLLTRQARAFDAASVQDGSVISEHELTKKILHARGIPDERIVILPGEIGSTADEARELAKFLEAKPTATVTVVTNGFHTRRARMVFGRMLGANASRVSFVGVPREDVDEETWWQTPDGCATYLMEYCKIPYYWLRY